MNQYSADLLFSWLLAVYFIELIASTKISLSSVDWSWHQCKNANVSGSIILSSWLNNHSSYKLCVYHSYQLEFAKLLSFTISGVVSIQPSSNWSIIKTEKMIFFFFKVIIMITKLMFKSLLLRRGLNYVINKVINYS